MRQESHAAKVRLPIAREARLEVGVSGVLLMLLVVLAGRVHSAWLWMAAGLALLIFLGLAAFMRDPERQPQQAGTYLAPADGEVMAVEWVDEPLFISGLALRIAIFLSLLDVHVNRAPASAVVRLVERKPGKFLQAFRPEAADRNEQVLIGFESEEGRVLVKQIAGILARRIVCRLQPGDSVSAGGRIGMIKFGSRTELFLPDGCRPLVKVGQHVLGGHSAVALPANGRSG
jgi:phosphatidylserine decarboxylase